LLFVSGCCYAAFLVFAPAVTSGGHAEVIFERTHEARSVPIARRVGNLLNWRVCRYQHGSRYL
jgi:hypothetical protein